LPWPSICSSASSEANRMATKKPISEKKYILRRAKNGRKRAKHIGAACYGKDKRTLQREASAMARRLGYRAMSISAYINIRLRLPH
jgi:hypothetical protein